MNPGIKFKSFSSGSCGNCYFLGYVDSEGKLSDAILIDAGVSPRRIRRELQRENLDPESIRAVLVTHDHLDHIRSLGSFCKTLKLPVWVPPALDTALRRHPFTKLQFASFSNVLSGEGWTAIPGTGLEAKWFEVPHDAKFTVGYSLIFHGRRFVFVTDCGKLTDEAVEEASKADTVVFESNYDADMLRNGPYPEELKARMCGGNGHISNDECADAVRRFFHPGLRQLFLCHLSDHNNTPELAFRAVGKALDEVAPPEGPRPQLVPLPRETPSALFNL